MDQEPGRCRRTDGKKWRCSKDVLPDQKYCERHMHRGRQRSRKHVEITKKVKESNSPKIFNSNMTTIAIKSPEIAKKNSDSSTQLHEILQPIHNPSSNTSYKVCSASTPACINSPIVYNRRKGHRNILSNSKSSTVAPGSDIPPKGVLQSGVDCDTSTGPLTETEPQRCRRTDGRKWRCNNNVLPEQKYCLQHIHRGVKKLTSTSDPIPIGIASFPSLPPTPKNSNTGPFISPTSTQRSPINENETSTTSGSSSDATTITDDENTSDSSRYIIKARTSDMQAPF